MQNEAYPFDPKHSKWDYGAERSVVCGSVCERRKVEKGRKNARGSCGPG